MLKERMMLKKRNEKGFTLAELLIVVAIIAVLVAIAIPIFTTQLEKSRQATDLANVRAAYAEAMTDALNNEDGTGTATSVPMTQHDGDWGELPDSTRVGDQTKDKLPQVSTKDRVTVTVSASGVPAFSVAE